MYVRRQTRPKPRKSQVKKWDAPIAGWVSNRALSDPQSDPRLAQGAAVLDNYFPMSSRVILRRGLDEPKVAGSTDIEALFSYKNANNKHLFAANATNIYDITTVVTSVVSGKTSGDWTAVQFATTGNVFLVGVNGADSGFLYDGLTFAALAVTFTGTGLTPADMSFVWVYKNRLWFAQKNSLDAWYLPVDSVAGAATRLPLAGIFAKGGALLFGQTWSLDSGAEGGLSEQNIFVSTEGEVAIFQGTDPASSTTWQKVGLYRIGTPLGKNAFFRGGGDVAIATTIGLVPLSKAVSLDLAALNMGSISYLIADAWSDALLYRGSANWCCELWPDLKMAVVSPPDLIGSSAPVVFISNAETGAWARYTGWRALCTEVFDGQLYFGSTDGKIYAANQTGADDGMPYTGVCMPLFEDLGSPANAKIGKNGRTVIRALTAIDDQLTMHTDFDLTMPSPPDASAGAGSSLWGTGEWGTSIWGASIPEYVSQGWRSVGGIGSTVSLSSQITSADIAPLDAEIIRFDFTYEVAEVLT